MKKKPTKAGRSCSACMTIVARTQAQYDEAVTNIENLSRLLSDSDKKRHELFEEVTGHVRQAETSKQMLKGYESYIKELEAERKRLSADNRMLFSLLVSERGHNDRRRSMEASNGGATGVAGATVWVAENGR
jgi:formyltetrahydrofolate hydrolase